MATLPWRHALAVCSLLALLSPAAVAEPLSRRLAADAQDGKLDDFQFIEAALIASGVEDAEELDSWRRKYAELRRQILTEPVAALPASERIAAIRQGLSKRILVGSYQAGATDLRMTLSRGDYNCLSAVAIELDLCRAAGLEMEIRIVPGHVWLRPAQANVDSSAARRISPLALVARFYYNRGAEHLQRRQFAVGLDLLRSSLELDPADSDARENLVAGLNNWAVEQYRAERYDRAAELIEQGLAIEPAYAPLVANQRLVRAKLGADWTPARIFLQTSLED